MAKFDSKTWVINEILSKDAELGKYRYGFTQAQLQKKDLNTLDKILSKLVRKEEMIEKEIPSSIKRVLGKRY